MNIELRREIAQEVRAAMVDVNEIYREEWLTADQLSKRIGCFTKSWLKAYGQALPRTHASVVDPDGNEAKTSWVYPLHKIQRMIMEGKIERLQVARLASRPSVISS